MSEPVKPGTIGWVDLTVGDAPVLRDFYARVAGWTPQPVSMGEYDDYTMMHPETGTPVAGVCHRRGPNEPLPPVWMIYIVVAGLEAALNEVEAAGGTVVKRPSKTGPGAMAIIQDPCGVYSALYQAT